MLLLGLLAIVAPLALGAPECFHEVNRLQEAYAYKFNIANMNETQYMEDLESIIDYELELRDGCPDPNYIEYGQKGVYVNARYNEWLFNKWLIPDNYHYMACKVTYCGSTQILDREIKGPPASKCHETYPVPKGGLCARAEQDTSMMTQRERQQWRENAIIDFLKKTEQERQMKQERTRSKYGRKSILPFKCPPGETPESIPGCYQSDEESTGIFGNWLRIRDDDKNSRNGPIDWENPAPNWHGLPVWPGHGL